MEPPICHLCGEDFRATEFRDDAQTGGLLHFARAPGQRELPEGWTGHPEHLGWFCRRHWAAASELVHLTRAEAVRRLRESCE